MCTMMEVYEFFNNCYQRLKITCNCNILKLLPTNINNHFNDFNVRCLYSASQFSLVFIKYPEVVAPLTSRLPLTRGSEYKKRPVSCKMISIEICH